MPIAKRILSHEPLMRTITLCETPLRGTDREDLATKLTQALSRRWQPPQGQQHQSVEALKLGMLELVHADDRERFVEDTYLMTIEDFETKTWGFIICPFGPLDGLLQIRLFHADPTGLTNVTAKMVQEFTAMKYHENPLFSFSEHHLIQVLPPLGQKPVLEGRITTKGQQLLHIMKRRKAARVKLAKATTGIALVTIAVSITLYAADLAWPNHIIHWIDGFFERISTASLFTAFLAWAQPWLDPLEIEDEPIIQWAPVRGTEIK
jgi:hypothetical protein